MSGTLETPQSSADYTLLARLAEHAERYDEMAGFMRQVVLLSPDLSMEERNLLSVAYKNVIGTRRSSWRLVVTLLNELSERAENGVESESSGKHHIEIVEPLKRKIEQELTEISNTVLDLLNNYLIPHAEDVELKVFYYKMAGDYYRYISEFAEQESKKQSANAAYDSYLKATEIARDLLSPTHPLRLGLALNFSVFYYEVLNSPSRACLLAKRAFDDAIPELDSLPDELYHDSKLIMKLLRDNLTYWQNEPALASETAGLEPTHPIEAGEPTAAEPAPVPAADASTTGAVEPDDREVSPTSK